MGNTVELIKSLTSGLSTEVINGLIDKDLSLWWDCTTPEIRAKIKSSLNGQGFMLALISDSMAVSYINKARPDLADILSTSKGKSWLMKLLRTLRIELLS